MSCYYITYNYINRFYYITSHSAILYYHRAARRHAALRQPPRAPHWRRHPSALVPLSPSIGIPLVHLPAFFRHKLNHKIVRTCKHIKTASGWTSAVIDSYFYVDSKQNTVIMILTIVTMLTMTID